jgi:D-3-phosphoglycerate dehydrogenase
LAKLNNIFAKHNINITGQYLKTDETLGYVIVDIEKSYSREFVQDIKGIAETIKFRMLF